MEEEHPLEYQIFALALKDPGAVSYFSDNLPPDVVGVSHVGLHQFYCALIDFYRKTGLDPIDSIAFRSWLETETDIYEALGGALPVSIFLDNILELELSTPEQVTAVFIYRSKKRRQLESLQELQLIIAKKEIKTPGDNERITFLTDQIRSLEHDIGYDPLARVDTGHAIAKRAEGLWDLPDFLSTPYKSLNEALGYDRDRGGAVRGAVYGILARSGAGKTTLARCLMNHWVENGHTVLFVNYEEAIAHWERTLFAQITHFNVYKSAQVSESERNHHTKVFKETMERWGNRFMVRHDPDTPFFEDLNQWLRDVIGHGENIPEVIIIDTIQSMLIKGSGGRPRWNQFEEMMVGLEKLAKDLNCVLLLTAQENNNRLKDRREVVNQSDIGGSVTIAQKATATIFITEKKLATDDDSEDDRIMQLQIPKNRITGTTFMSDPPLVKYIDDWKSYVEVDIPDASLYQVREELNFA